VHHANTSTAAVTGGMLFILLVVPATTAHDVAEIVDRVRAGLPEGRTMSVGVDLAPAARPLSDMVQRADQTLYQVKRSRRGATRVFGADLDALPASA
jgi:predicted signal transduction protein with EAL and GGDEF domain